MSVIASIAILPFSDLSQAGDQTWFCDGLAEEIIDSLSCVRGLRVASRTASFRFRDGSVDPREIGRLLSVDAILEGSVRKAGEHLKVTAQLIDAANGYHLWSESFARPLEDVFAIQSEIAGNVAQALRLSLSTPALERSVCLAPDNLEATSITCAAARWPGRRARLPGAADLVALRSGRTTFARSLSSGGKTCWKKPSPRATVTWNGSRTIRTSHRWVTHRAFATSSRTYSPVPPQRPLERGAYSGFRRRKSWIAGTSSWALSSST